VDREGGEREDVSSLEASTPTLSGYNYSRRRCGTGVLV